MLIAPWIFIRFIANLVRECTFIRSLLVLNIDTMELQVCVFIAIFAKCAKRNQSPCSPPTAKKKNKEIKTNFGHSYLRTANKIPFRLGMWRGLPGRHLCSETSFNRIRDHGATKV